MTNFHEFFKRLYFFGVCLITAIFFLTIFVLSLISLIYLESLPVIKNTPNIPELWLTFFVIWAIGLVSWCTYEFHNILEWGYWRLKIRSLRFIYN